MSRDNSSAPSILAGIAAPSSNTDYTAAPTGSVVSTLRLQAHRTVDDDQITGGDELSDMGRGIAMLLSACLSAPPMGMWLETFREHAAECPDEAHAIAAAFVEFALRDSKVTP